MNRKLAHEDDKIVSPTHRPPLPPTGDTLATRFCSRLSLSQVRSVAGRLKSMKNPNDPIGNQTDNFQACSTARQLTATLRHSPVSVGYLLFLCVMLVE